MSWNAVRKSAWKREIATTSGPSLLALAMRETKSNIGYENSASSSARLCPQTSRSPEFRLRETTLRQMCSRLGLCVCYSRQSWMFSLYPSVARSFQQRLTSGKLLTPNISYRQSAFSQECERLECEGARGHQLTKYIIVSDLAELLERNSQSQLKGCISKSVENIVFDCMMKGWRGRIIS
jgi:hypothetical protein